MKTKRTTLVALGGALIIIALFVLFASIDKTVEITSTSIGQNPQPVVIPQAESITRPLGSADPLIPEGEETPYRIRFNDSCQASPSVLTVPHNAEVRLVNRAEARRMITVGEKVYSIRPETSITVIANDVGTLAVYCDQYKTAELTVVR